MKICKEKKKEEKHSVILSTFLTTADQFSAVTDEMPLKSRMPRTLYEAETQVWNLTAYKVK